MKVAVHKRLQTYEHHYGMVCLTGLFGCRWHRYQQSTEASTRSDVAWIVVLATAALYAVIWLYYWLLAENSRDSFNWYIYDKTHAWAAYYTVVFALACVSFSYVALLVLLALCHAAHKHQVYMHSFHRAIIVLVILCSAAVTIVVTQVWSQGWLLQYTSLMITAPWLHLVAVAVITGLTWFFVEWWLGLYRISGRVVSLGFYIALVGLLYVVPIFIRSPCITDHLPHKPHLVGHRGAAAIAPENTLISFQYAALYNAVTFESDVTISYDGVPFLLHDDTFRRTTNIADVFPKLVDRRACWFNMSQISQLDAGSWFIKRDPFRALWSVDDSQESQYINESVPTLTDLLKLAKMEHKNVMFDIKFSHEHECPNHPFNETYGQLIVDTITKSGISPDAVWWLYTDNIDGLENPPYTRVHGGPASLFKLNNKSIQMVNMEFGSVEWDGVSIYHNNNITTNFYVVDSPWLYSLYWCMGVQSVTTNRAHAFSVITQPVWLLTPHQFKVMWITADVISAVLIIVLFVVQKIRKTGKQFPTEKMSLQGARIRMSHIRKNRNMKEKLLHTVECIQEMEGGIMGMPTGTDESKPTTPESVPSDSCPRGSVPNNPCASTSARSEHSRSASVDASSCNGITMAPNRLSSASGISGISGISGMSAISGLGPGDSSLNATFSEEEVRDANLSDINLEVPG